MSSNTQGGLSKRAWIMIERHRADGEAMHIAEEKMKRLRCGDYQANIRDVLTLQGHVDVAVVYESREGDKVDPFEAVGFLRKQIGSSAWSTTTYVAGDLDPREYPMRSEIDPSAYLIGIRTTHAAPDDLLSVVRGISEVRLADGVWGDFDIIALVLGKNGIERTYRAILSEIANLPGVSRVTTMQEIR